jgi:hypothetical protein
MERRSERLARNEALFREVNERIQEVSRRTGTGDGLELLCECGRRDCLQVIQIVPTEYETIRSKPDRFLVAPGHEHPEIERVVRRTEAFHVVEKVGEAGAVAEATDPRT